jgi:hypothetical protein
MMGSRAGASAVSTVADSSTGSSGIPQKIAAEGVFYTKLLKEVDPKLVTWEAKTEIK